jgi:hypothetical protein
MKGLDAIWVDTMIRLKQAKAPPKKTLKLALTCGEESDRRSTAPTGWRRTGRPGARRLRLNEGGGGRLGPDGKREALSCRRARKAYQDFRLTVTNPGGHSSRPRPDNAIYQLADALTKIRGYTFPVKFTDATRRLVRPRVARGDAPGLALQKLMANPSTPRPRRSPPPTPHQRHPAHQLRADPAVGRPCAERPAPARHRQRQLPHLHGREHRGDPPDPDPADRRPGVTVEATNPTSRSPCRRRWTRR